MGIDPLQSAGKIDEGKVVARGLLVAGGNAPAGFQLVEETFDQIAPWPSWRSGCRRSSSFRSARANPATDCQSSSARQRHSRSCDHPGWTCAHDEAAGARSSFHCTSVNSWRCMNRVNSHRARMQVSAQKRARRVGGRPGVTPRRRKRAHRASALGRQRAAKGPWRPAQLGAEGPVCRARHGRAQRGRWRAAAEERSRHQPASAERPLSTMPRSYPPAMRDTPRTKWEKSCNPCCREPTRQS